MTNIYVGNLPRSISPEELEQAFGAHGTVERVSIITDRETGESRGFAFVEMADDSEAQKAIQAMNGTDLGGRTITVNLARAKEERTGGGGRREGGGYGGGGGGGGGRERRGGGGGYGGGR